MEQKPEHGYLVLADISGYTCYLAGVELDHAQGVLTDLLETIVASFQSLLTISKLEGDAVFGYVAASQVSRSETLIEFVEAAYMAFRDRQDGIRLRTTCTCNACRAIPTLDLKFIIHYGHYMRQSIAGIPELVGSDVNLVHRLLKNHVSDGTGWRAYALFTGQTLEHVVAPCDPRDLLAQTEQYDHLGEVQTYSLDLHKRHDALNAERHIVIEDQDADVILDYDFSVSQAVLWEFMNDPRHRDQWMPGAHWSAGARPGGRTGPGAQNHCAHGKDKVSTEVIMDWKPFRYATMHQFFGPDKYWAVTYRLAPLPDGQGTHLHIALRGVIGKLSGPLRHLLTMGLLSISKYRQVFDTIPVVVARELAAQPPADASVAAPVVRPLDNRRPDTETRPKSSPI